MAERLILVTNDDDVTAGGIAALVEVAQAFGRVVVVAPERPQSAKGHAITISEPLRLKSVDLFDGVEAIACSGTPVDCVKIAVNQVLDRRPDLVLSGVNHGSNASINVVYSGTMSAAMEGAIEGIPSIGFSLLDYAYDADFSASQVVVREIVGHCLEKGFPDSKLLNVNIPKGASDAIKGWKICRQARARWKEEFDHRQDPFGRDYFWLTGKFLNDDEGSDTDIAALNDNYVSVVPVQADLTAHSDVQKLKKLWG